MMNYLFILMTHLSYYVESSSGSSISKLIILFHIKGDTLKAIIITFVFRVKTYINIDDNGASGTSQNVEATTSTTTFVFGR